jgi:signal transduction histidine kinase
MKTPKESAPDIPFERVSRFVRQITHDVRNGLNAVDLQAAFLSEIVTDDECRVEARRLREMVGNVTMMLHRLSGEFQEIWLTPLTCAAKIFLEDAKERLDCEFGARMKSVKWSVDIDEKQIEIDLEAGFRAITELVGNALKYREPGAAILVKSSATEGAIEVSVSEGKSSLPENIQAWGREPLLNASHRGYGMGLFRLTRTMEKLNGSVTRVYDPAERQLVTTLTIPLSLHG